MFKLAATIVPAFALLLAASPVFAQGATQSPPSPNAAVSGPTPAGSVPAGAQTMSPSASPNVGGALGTTTTVAPGATTGPGAAMSTTVPVAK